VTLKVIKEGARYGTIPEVMPTVAVVHGRAARAAGGGQATLQVGGVHGEGTETIGGEAPECFLMRIVPAEPPQAREGRKQGEGVGAEESALPARPARGRQTRKGHLSGPSRAPAPLSLYGGHHTVSDP
jgi:hypothetical protein